MRPDSTTGTTGTDQTPGPSRNDTVTTDCPVCHHDFTPSGRRAYCSDACKARAYRRRHIEQPLVLVPDSRPRRPITIYECDKCGTRALGEQRCQDCGTFMRRIDYEGHCPSCNEPIALSELQTP